jgi:hypothetical protein
MPIATATRPSRASSTPDETKEAYNANHPRHDRERFLDQFVHVLGHTGNYKREEAIAVIDADRLLPDMMSYDPSKPAGYPNGRTLTHHVIAHRFAFISKGDIPPDGLKPHSDLLSGFPYLGTPAPLFGSTQLEGPAPRPRWLRSLGCSPAMIPRSSLGAFAAVSSEPTGDIAQTSPHQNAKTNPIEFVR